MASQLQWCAPCHSRPFHIIDNAAPQDIWHTRLASLQVHANLAKSLRSLGDAQGALKVAAISMQIPAYELSARHVNEARI